MVAGYVSGAGLITARDACCGRRMRSRPAAVYRAPSGQAGRSYAPLAHRLRIHHNRLDYPLVLPGFSRQGACQ